MEKEILTLQEFADYTGFKLSYVYKLTHRNLINFYKPQGKCIFIKLEDAKAFLLQNKQSAISSEDIQSECAAFLINGKNRKRRK